MVGEFEIGDTVVHRDGGLVVKVLSYHGVHFTGHVLTVGHIFNRSYIVGEVVGAFYADMFSKVTVDPTLEIW